ncbi:MAG TPA: hypothetical protein VJ717_06525 [Gemmatimonadaceae bacterium]|nr:hypothetical protein [Gemmatimonadaceae bacterium]
MPQPNRTLLETRTSASPSDVLQRAKDFFSGRNSIYTAYVEREGPQYVTLRGQGGEELIVHAASLPAGANGTAVTGSSYLFDAQIARFFTTLPPAAESA